MKSFRMDGVVPLPLDARESIRSGISTPTFSQCAEELLANSLDAKSTRIVISFDVEQYSFTVVDNGLGFSERDLEIAGHRYTTSKCSSIDDVERNLRFFGYRGEALASIAQVSDSVEITSATADSNIVLRKVIERGTINKGITKLAGKGAMGQETKIAVRGLFKNLPVRRSEMNAQLECESLKRRVQRISLINPQSSFTLNNEAEPDLNPILNVPKHKSCLARFQALFEHIGPTQFMRPVNYLSPDSNLVLEGGISRQGYENKSLQFIYVNGRPVLQTKLHKEMNNCTRMSDLGRRQVHLWDVNQICSKLEGSEDTVKQSKKRTYAVYFLNIKCPYSSYDISYEPAKTAVEFKNWNSVLACVRNMVTDFLVAENLLSVTREQEKNAETGASGPCVVAGRSSDLLVEDMADEMVVISKIAKAIPDRTADSNGRIPTPARFAAENGDQPKHRVSSTDCVSSSQISRCDVPDDDTSRRVPEIFRKGNQQGEQQTDKENKESSDVNDLWISKYDSRLRRMIYIHAISGMCSLDKPTATTERQQLTEAFSTNQIKKPLTSRHFFLSHDYAKFIPRQQRSGLALQSHAENRSEASKKLTGKGLGSWVNPAIPTRFGAPGLMSVREFSSLLSASTSIKFDTGLFATMQFIGQMDNKFLICKVQASDNSNDTTFVIFDQHAVHERIRLECLEGDLFFGDCIQSHLLETPLLLNVEKGEFSQLKAWRGKFARIGLQYEVKKSGHAIITTIPRPFIRKVEKIRKEEDRSLTKMVYALIKEQLNVFRDMSGASYGVPKTIHEVLCSEACHGAVKFGHKLAPNQCQFLLDRLARCKLPFQCAHGRPSITPVVISSMTRTEKRSSLNLKRLHQLIEKSRGLKKAATTKVP